MAVAQLETSAASPIASAGIASSAKAEPSLAGAAPLSLTGERRAAFETYVATRLAELAVPGASVAVVQNGEVVYLQGFGVRALGEASPVTPDTRMMIGSVTKGMTSLMAATVVDDGWLTWDTPVGDLLPGFRVADPTLTPRLTVADAFCMCTGLPAHDVDLVLDADAFTPNRLIASVADLPLTAPLGERFQYNNQMYAIGGYAATVAAGAAPNDLLRAYDLAMRERVLNPIGMDGSTFSLDEVLRSGDYALPHANDLAGQMQPVPLLADERFVTSVAPAGALWSNARDMARYAQTVLANGVAPNGARVVSAENLSRIRQPRVAMPSSPDAPPLFNEAAQGYGMGWGVGEWHGLWLESHSGGTFGFGSEIALLPAANLGVVILTNGGEDAGVFTLAVQFHLFDLLFDQAPELDPILDQYLPAQAAQLAALQQQLRPVDPAAVAPFLGRYANPTLGDVALRMQGDRLLLDAGEVRSTLRPRVDETGQAVAYLFADPPLAGPNRQVILRRGSDGRQEVVLEETGEQPGTYVFTLVEPRAGTPAP